MLLAYDKTKFEFEVSPTVKACTVSRLYDGKNYSEQDLIEAERVIANCQGKEREFLKDLCHRMNQWNDPEFHHELWYSLLCLNDNKYSEAREHLNKVLKRSYDHPRIFDYLNRTKVN